MSLSDSVPVFIETVSLSVDKEGCTEFCGELAFVEVEVEVSVGDIVEYQGTIDPLLLETGGLESRIMDRFKHSLLPAL